MAWPGPGRARAERDVRPAGAARAGEPARGGPRRGGVARRGRPGLPRTCRWRGRQREEARLCLTPEGGRSRLGGTAGLPGRAAATGHARRRAAARVAHHDPLPAARDRRRPACCRGSATRCSARGPVPAAGWLAPGCTWRSSSSCIPALWLRLAAPAGHPRGGHGLRAGRRLRDRRGGDPQRGGLGADHAALAGARRAGPLRLHAERSRSSATPRTGSSPTMPAFSSRARDRARRDAAPTRWSAWSTRARRGWPADEERLTSGRWRRRRGRRTTGAATCSRPRRTCPGYYGLTAASPTVVADSRKHVRGARRDAAADSAPGGGCRAVRVPDGPRASTAAGSGSRWRRACSWRSSRWRRSCRAW